VEGDGAIIKLDDGTLWEVDDADVVTSSVWVAPADAVVCDGKIINTDENESVEAQPVDVRAAYTIQAAADDETFVIDGEVFKAQTYCFNVERGDRVKFLEGSPLGACASASFLDLRTSEVCEVWCE
jgi:hypothetical protein